MQKKKKNHAFLGVLRLGFRGPLRLSAPWAFKNTGHVILVLSACFPTKELFNDVNVTGWRDSECYSYFIVWCRPTLILRYQNMNLKEQESYTRDFWTEQNTWKCGSVMPNLRHQQWRMTACFLNYQKRTCRNIFMHGSNNVFNMLEVRKLYIIPMLSYFVEIFRIGMSFLK